MKQSRMMVQNWVMVGLGVFLMYFGFFLVSFVKLNYEGVYALISMSTIVAGILIVLLGLWIGFEKE
ncbi:MAG: hypothetical protein ACK4HQ_06275 [Brevinematales bacterium]